MWVKRGPCSVSHAHLYISGIFQHWVCRCSGTIQCQIINIHNADCFISVTEYWYIKTVFLGIGIYTITIIWSHDPFYFYNRNSYIGKTTTHTGTYGVSFWVCIWIPIIKMKWSWDHLIFLMRLPIPRKNTQRWSHDHLIFIMGIPILIRHVYIEMDPCI